MPKRWCIHPHDPDRIAALAGAARLPAVVAELMICRGITDPDSARAFLEPKLSDLRDPESLPGCTEAAERMHRAIAAKKRIVVYGDYDVDGMAGTAILWLCLKLLGADVGYYIPHRINEGYGLNCEAIRQQADENVGLLISVDCGIGSIEEAQLAAQLGLELIVTDHHEPGDELPQAAAVVHPRLPGENYPFAGLSGSGVAMKLAWALCQKASGAKKVSPPMREFLMQAIGLAALGTVADVVPLVDENRVLVQHGLRSLATRPTVGMAELMQVAKVDQNVRIDRRTGAKSITSEDVAFSLAPRLNAAGRLGQPQLGVELLLTDRADRAEELANYIDGLNSTRRTLERSIQLAAGRQIKERFDPVEDSALVLADRGWNQGVIGIVAGQLAEKYHRPVVMISLNQHGIKPGVGSARSVPGFDLRAALAACDEYLLGHGGHKAAAGLQIEEGRLEGFRAAFCEVAAAEISADNRVPQLAVDAEAPLSAFTLEAVHQIESLSPFGQQNPRPLLCTSGVSLAGPPKPIGSGGRHLSLHLHQHDVKLRAVFFGGGDSAGALAALDGPFDVAFRPVINTFRNRHSVELHLVDWRS